jgi:F-type H+-transporting ATPase subunit delta
VTLGGIGKRYAIGLFNAALHEDIVDQVQGDTASFARLVESDRAFRRFLSSQQVSPGEKKDMVVRAIGDRASGLFVKFILLLIEKRRIDRLKEIADAFEALYEEHSGILRVSITTAVPLDADLERRARAAVERRTGKTARIVKRVDPDILGGVILLAGDKIIDGSIRNRLGEMRRELLELRVH